MPHRIIVPLDQSPIAESALPLARGLARQLNLPVTLVSVLDVPPSFAKYAPGGEVAVTAGRSDGIMPQSPFGRWSGWSGADPSSRQLDHVAGETANAEQYLRKIAESFGDTIVETAVRFGQPAARVLDMADERDGVIVIASHGRGGIRRAVVGSVAARVVQGARTPVFVVRGAGDGKYATEESVVRKALVPLDGSPFSEHAIVAAQEIFGQGALDLHLINVVEQPTFASGSRMDDYLQWLSGRVGTAENTVSCETCEGAPSDAINRIANEKDVDLIVMSTRGSSGVQRFLIGSVAERVLQEATRPLLLVRPPEM